VKNEVTITAAKGLTTCLVPHEECRGKYFDTLGLGLEIACLCSCGHKRIKMIKHKMDEQEPSQSPTSPQPEFEVGPQNHTTSKTKQEE